MEAELALRRRTEHDLKMRVDNCYALQMVLNDALWDCALCHWLVQKSEERGKHVKIVGLGMLP